MTIDRTNIINVPLGDRKKIIVSPIYIKLGLMKKFVMALDKDGNYFQYGFKSFTRLSMEKIKIRTFMALKFISLSRILISQNI